MPNLVDSVRSAFKIIEFPVVQFLRIAMRPTCFSSFRRRTALSSRSAQNSQSLPVSMIALEDGQQTPSLTGIEIASVKLLGILNVRRIAKRGQDVHDVSKFVRDCASVRWLLRASEQ